MTMSMIWTELHARLLSTAFEEVLGRAEKGALAFTRCLAPEVVERLASDGGFEPAGWQVFRVVDADDPRARTITADRAVELREAKGSAVVLLVDTSKAGAGMDGIYSAAREIQESELFSRARRKALHEIAKALSREARGRAEQALKRTQRRGRGLHVSYWAEFDFLVRSVAQRRDPGELLYLVGLWPAQPDPRMAWARVLDLSWRFVDRTLGLSGAALTPPQRIESLRLLNLSDDQRMDLERFIRSAASKPIFLALEELADKQHLWIGALQTENVTQELLAIEILPWRTSSGRIVKWSGLVEDEDFRNPPLFILKPDADRTGDYSKLEVRWKARPENLERGTVIYRIAVLTDMDEELAVREVPHRGKKEEKCSFANDDFSELDEDVLLSAHVEISAIESHGIETQKTEEFTIRFGQPPQRAHAGVGKTVRTFSEGVIEINDRQRVAELLSAPLLFVDDAKGFVLLGTPELGKSFRVARPALVREVEQQWLAQGGPIGRWRVKVRASGERVGKAEFLRIPLALAPGEMQPALERVASASRRMADRFGDWGGGVGQVYDDASRSFETVVKEYILAWAALLEEADPKFALAHTVEVQTLSGRTVGMIVLPSHPLRVAWHVAYDSLVLHAAFQDDAAPKDVREELKILDGALFPPFLPGLEKGRSFVFADTLGFHAVGMVADDEREPKAAVALLRRALGQSEAEGAAPTVGQQSAQVLADEILKYIECHNVPRELHIHALRPGDGFTVARALGKVTERSEQEYDDEGRESGDWRKPPRFILELYPSPEQRTIAGRFIADALEKRRRGAVGLAPEDDWMLRSFPLPGNLIVPRLRWARKERQEPATAAHLAVAFDTFESRVVGEGWETPGKPRPYYAYGLLSFFERHYTDQPTPCWRSCLLPPEEGEKHPADRAHSERLVRLQKAILSGVARNLDGKDARPTLLTEVRPEKAHSLRQLHRLCDWVITLDRNAGVEYFDSPKTNREVYDAYVIDCVPEREDLGCMQLITSTSNLEEVRNLLDDALDQMGLSHSRRNAEFLMQHLKALSGRLAIRLTGQSAPTTELIALALSHAHCGSPQSEEKGCWLPLQRGFFIPVDDVLDLLPPLAKGRGQGAPAGGRPDLLYVSLEHRRGLAFQFIEVKYRRHLRTARNIELINDICRQTRALRERWETYYSREGVLPPFRAVRMAKLARVLRFYAKKAHRHQLLDEHYNELVGEIDRMVARSSEYDFSTTAKGDRGWVFCPEYYGYAPSEISSGTDDTRVFLFGAGCLAESDFRGETIGELAPLSGRASKVDLPTSSPRSELATRISGAPAPPVGATTAAAPQVEPPRVSGGSPASYPAITLGTDCLTSVDVSWPLAITGNPHLLRAGLPGMGKTTCLLNLCQQMLAAGVRPIVFSYHEDIDDRLEKLVGEVRFIDFRGLGFNPLQVINRELPTAYLDVAGALRDIFMAVYPELGDIQGERIRKAIKESFIELGWDNLGADPRTLREPAFVRFFEMLQSDPRPDHSLRTLLGRLEELADYGFFQLADSYESLWEAKGATVIRIHGTQNDNLQRAFASLVFYGLYKDMFRRGVRSRITHAVIFDEAHRAARLRLIPTMAKECRKYGVSLVLASQEAKDFHPSLFSAIANYLVLRLTETDAKALVRNVASSDQERALIDKIKQMERFRALYFSEGRKRPALVCLRAV